MKAVKAVKPAKAPSVELVKMAELSKRSGVPSPTIKHYIREGLLQGPEIRTSRNMAYYDARMVERIRVIKALQAERFLPLRVIGELLEPAPSSRIKPERDAQQRKALTALSPVLHDRLGNERRKRSEIIRTLGVTRAELEHLERIGVLELRGDGDTAGYGGGDLVLLDVLATIRRLGLGEVFPTSLAEPYLAAVRTLVELEIDLFRHRVLSAGALPLPLPEILQHAVELGQQVIVALRAKLLPQMLAQLAGRA